MCARQKEKTEQREKGTHDQREVYLSLSSRSKVSLSICLSLCLCFCLVHSLCLSLLDEVASQAVYLSVSVFWFVFVSVFVVVFCSVLEFVVWFVSLCRCSHSVCLCLSLMKGQNLGLSRRLLPFSLLVFVLVSVFVIVVLRFCSVSVFVCVLAV